MGSFKSRPSVETKREIHSEITMSSTSSHFMTKSKNSSSKKCKAINCDIEHSQHYCKWCKDFDSDHRSLNCPLRRNIPTRKTRKKGKCKVPNCFEDHDSHYCRVCLQKDIDHFSSNCPEALVLYHGTRLDYAKNIMKEGFKSSAYGRKGPGVYFTDDFEVAAKCGQRKKHKQNSDGRFAVIECKFKENSEHAQKHQHPTWESEEITNEPFWQYVIQEDYLKELKIVKIHELQHEQQI